MLKREMFLSNWSLNDCLEPRPTLSPRKFVLDSLVITNEHLTCSATESLEFGTATIITPREHLIAKIATPE